MSIIVALIVVIALTIIPFGLSVISNAVNFAGIPMLLGVGVPYIAIAVFIFGFLYRIVDWAKSPVPFKIPTTCGQQKTLPWIKHSKLESPTTKMEVFGRMALEVLFFRSLIRNTKSYAFPGKTPNQPQLAYQTNPHLWLLGLAFHYSFLIIVLRHFRLFIDPVPFFVGPLESLDGFVQLTLPTFYLTDAIIVGAVTALFLRRVGLPIRWLRFSHVRTISLTADYFPLLLILAIAVSGIMMRYLFKVDVTTAKMVIAGIFTFNFAGIDFLDLGHMFYVHVFLVSSLLIYFPFSKLMHMGGVFMSPTRNMPNDSRMNRHINPWNPDIKHHTYEEYEDDFRDVMKMAGLPLEKDVAPEAAEEKEEGEGS